MKFNYLSKNEKLHELVNWTGQVLKMLLYSLANVFSPGEQSHWGFLKNGMDNLPFPLSSVKCGSEFRFSAKTLFFD